MMMAHSSSVAHRFLKKWCCLSAPSFKHTQEADHIKLVKERQKYRQELSAEGGEEPKLSDEAMEAKVMERYPDPVEPEYPPLLHGLVIVIKFTGKTTA